METFPFLDFLVISHVLAAECDRHKLLITLKAQLCIWQLTVAVVDEYHFHRLDINYLELKLSSFYMTKNFARFLCN